ncbi:hypothetical protein Ddye_024215 [Dipteronia dyeriana]|uniref:RNase H type-1 domain-containing protein n=1 Tax=Dipteronia dyeriana TaxID=168575 RepID=A0AAD9WU15_9ROSI|nr:hypothetical protein Ddye_024215 [Dipteronia dyeriana]
MIGYGAIIRENSGGVKAAGIKNAKATLDPIIAEAMAVKYGILLALESNLVPFQIETDSLQLVNILCEGRIPSADVGPVIGEILGLLEPLPCWSIRHVPRLGNLVAHSLAKMGLSAASDCSWLNGNPPCVEKFIKADACL